MFHQGQLLVFVNRRIASAWKNASTKRFVFAIKKKKIQCQSEAKVLTKGVRRSTNNLSLKPMLPRKELSLSGQIQSLPEANVSTAGLIFVMAITVFVKAKTASACKNSISLKQAFWQWNLSSSQQSSFSLKSMSRQGHFFSSTRGQSQPETNVSTKICPRQWKSSLSLKPVSGACLSPFHYFTVSWTSPPYAAMKRRPNRCTQPWERRLKTSL